MPFSNRSLRRGLAVFAAAERSAAASGVPVAKSAEVVTLRKPSKVSPKVRGPKPVDVHVGSRIRLRRKMLGLSQQKLADALGLSFQQVQKYEKGANRVGASRLTQIANVLTIPASFFFEGVPDANMSAAGTDENAVMAFLSTKEGIALNRAFVKITDPKVRRSILEMVKAAAKANSE